MNENDRTDAMDPDTQPDLLGYYLGLLDDAESAELTRRLEQSAELRSRLDAVRADLRPLDALAVSAPGRDMVDRILARAAATPRLASVPRAVRSGRPARSRSIARVRSATFVAGQVSERLPSGDEFDTDQGPTISLRELIGLAAAIALFAGVVVPTYNASRNRAQRTACLANMQRIGAANAEYAATFDGMLPYAGPQNGPWLSAAANTSAMPNSRHVYLLLRNTSAVSPSDFVCAGRTQDRAMKRADVQTAMAFPSPANVSYSTPLTDETFAMAHIDPAFSMLADQNPQFDGGVYRPRDRLNSDSHGFAAGQNYLRADGGAGWTDQPNVGPENDNIMDMADVTSYTGWERPRYRSDVVLVP
jgi:hypothetical protein